jgi:hypothetical protein
MGGYLDVALRRPGVLALMFRSDVIDRTTPEFAAAAVPAFDQLVDVVRACQARGWHPDEPAVPLAVSVWSASHGLAMLVTQSSLPPGAVTTVDGQLDVLVTLLTSTSEGILR